MKNVRAAFLALLLTTTTFAGDTNSPGDEPPPPPPPGSGQYYDGTPSDAGVTEDTESVLSSIYKILSELF